MGLLVPVALAATLTGCNDGGVQPGVVNTSAAQGYRGETGRVVEIREVPIKRGGSGMNDGTLIGGGLGAAGGAVIGGATTNSVGGAVIGGLLGAVAGGIAGTAMEAAKIVFFVAIVLFAVSAIFGLMRGRSPRI